MNATEKRAANLELLNAYFDLIATGDVDELATYWADDLVFEAPFSYTGTPSRTDGKEAIYARLSNSYGMVSMAFHITEIYKLADPDAFIVEYDSEGHMLGTGEPYNNRYISLVPFRDSKMTLLREFYDSKICGAAF